MRATSSSLDEKLAKALIEFPGGFTEPIYCGDPPFYRREPACATGTATLLRLEAAFFVITCQHVLEHYRQQSHPRHFQIGEFPLDPEEQLISESKKLDLAVLKIRPEQIVDERRQLGLSRERFFGPHRWPPDPVTVEDVVSFVGFPGVWREQVGLNRLASFALGHGAAGVKSVNESRFVSSLDLADCESLLNLKEVTDLGGMSGGPVFRWRRRELAPELVGIIYEYQDTLDLLYIRSTSVIGKDGMIDAHAG